MRCHLVKRWRIAEYRPLWKISRLGQRHGDVRATPLAGLHMKLGADHTSAIQFKEHEDPQAEDRC